MEAIRKLSEITVDLPAIIEPSTKAFYPLLHANRDSISAVPRKTFQYGPSPRHALDIYYPPPTVTDVGAVLTFSYGGGFVSGDKQFAAPHDLIYANLGAFFAQRGFTVVIPDYRLAPAHPFPAGADDVLAALTYIQDTDEAQIGISKETRESVFVMGHSAGAIHIITMALRHWDLGTTLDLSKIKGLILAGPTLSFSPSTTGFSTPYYGPSPSELKIHEPLGLLLASPPSHVGSLPPILLGRSEFELGFIPPTHDVFSQEFEKRGGKKIDTLVFEGHNHVSLSLALGSGSESGEVWGERVAEWCKARIS